MVYEPAEDTFLLEKAVDKFAYGDVLEIASGSGHLVEVSAQNKKIDSITATDIDKESVDFMKKKKIPKTKVILSDLFKNIKGTFDTIFCNPPYLPEDHREPVDSQLATTGGKKGHEFTIRFLEAAHPHLNPDGIILLVVSSQGNKFHIDNYLKENLWDSEIVGQKSMFFEILYIYKIARSETKKQIDAIVSNATYVAKGRRSIVLKGIFKKKPCAVKVSTASHFDPSIEASWIKKMNSLGIGPELYLVKTKFLIVEWIQGSRILEYLEQQKNPGIKEKVITKVLNEMFTLDINNITKEEMHHPVKHIIVTNKNKPILIDFERCHQTNKPKNLTQFIQFLCSQELKKLLSNTHLRFDRNTLHHVLQMYKASPNKQTFAEIMEKII